MYWPGLDELTDEQVTHAHAIITQMLAEKCPELEVDRGAFGSLVAELHAVMQGCSMAAIEKLQHSLCARDVAMNPELALPAAVDALASNMRIRRRISSKARGDVTVVLTRSSGVNFGPNSKFRANGQFFNVDGTFTTRPPGASQRTRYDICMYEYDAGKYAVQVPVIAKDVNQDAMLKRFDLLQPTVTPGGFVTAFASNDFVGGCVPQTNRELVNQFAIGLAAPDWSGIENIKALVRASGEDIYDIAVIGARDPEMTRDCDSNGVSRGGSLDIYLKVSTTAGSDNSANVATAARVQDFLDTHMQPGLDVRVVAAVPLFVGVNITVKDPACDVAAVSGAAATYINNLYLGEAPSKFALTRLLPEPDDVVDVEFTEAVASRTCAYYGGQVHVHVED